METYLTVVEPVADLRGKPIPAAEMGRHDHLQETQVLFNETLLLIDESRDWYHVEAMEQKRCAGGAPGKGYRGWVHKECVSFDDGPLRRDITVKNRFASIRKEPREGSMLLGHVLLGTRFAASGSTHDCFHGVILPGGETGWIQEGDVKWKNRSFQDRAGLRRELVDTARLFLGSPYFWGGRSMPVPKGRLHEFRVGKRGQAAGGRRRPPFIFGVDCSGLVDLVYRANNVDIPRNAADQWLAAEKMEMGRLKPGDVIFIPSEEDEGKIVHVMLYCGGEHLLEAFETGSVVRMISFKERFGMDMAEIIPSGKLTGKRYLQAGNFIPSP